MTIICVHTYYAYMCFTAQVQNYTETLQIVSYQNSTISIYLRIYSD